MYSCIWINCFGIDKVSEHIKTFIMSKKDNDMIKKFKENVIEELLYLRYNFKYNGTNYIMESIIFIIESNNKNLLDNLERNVYKVIAKNHCTSIYNIKNNISKSTNNMYIDCESDRLVRYFSLSSDIKPTPKMVISAIVNKIKMSKEYNSN